MSMPPFLFRAPPVEIIVSEVFFFLIVFALCIGIYTKTKGIYELTRHKGILFFRNIFLFFAFAYLFRLGFTLIIFTGDVSQVRAVGSFVLPAVSLFSTLAILSIFGAVFSKSLEKVKGLDVWMVCIALISTILTVLTKSHKELLVVQTLVFLCAIILIVIQRRKQVITQNTMTYSLLFLFWVLSVIAFNKRLVPYEYKIPLYLLSVGIFFWIYLRVHKRLSHAKKR